MMTWYLIIFVFMVLMGAFALAYQIFRLTELDAKCRGLKHPKWWGLFSLSGNNGSGGLILYLIGRRKYPITMNNEEKTLMNSRKKRAGAALIFMAVGMICLMSTCILSFN
ncbi:MAG: hypothetical protein ACLROI_07720 [Beduini sp.]|uniref:hypothetical protein n=1 Tax=Beduini sp. TaxID=1922300 RepID=UPI003990A35A